MVMSYLWLQPKVHSYLDVLTVFAPCFLVTFLAEECCKLTNTRGDDQYRLLWYFVQTTMHSNSMYVPLKTHIEIMVLNGEIGMVSLSGTDSESMNHMLSDTLGKNIGQRI